MYSTGAQARPRCRLDRFPGSRPPRFAASTPCSCSARSKPAKDVSSVRNPSGNGICAKPGSKFTIQSFNDGIPPACCEPSVRPWKAFSYETITFLPCPPVRIPSVRQSLMAHSTVSDPVVSRNTFLSGAGSSGRNSRHQSGADLAREAVVGQQVRLRLTHHGIDDFFGTAVTGIGDEHPGGPIDPAVAPAVVHLEAFGVVPDDGRLTPHGDGLNLVQRVQSGVATPAPGSP